MFLFALKDKFQFKLVTYFYIRKSFNYLMIALEKILFESTVFTTCRIYVHLIDKDLIIISGKEKNYIGLNLYNYKKHSGFGIRLQLSEGRLRWEYYVQVLLKFIPFVV